MKEIITVNNNTLSVREINGNRVVTFKEIDTLHNRPAGTASRNFQTNRAKFIEDVDFYLLKPADLQNNEFRVSGFEHEKINSRGVTMITESGYLMLVKSFDDELAWQVQRQLINAYFKATPEISRSSSIDTLIQLLTQQNQSILQSMSSMRENYAAQQQQLMTLTTLITATIPQPYKPPFTHWMNTALKRADVIAAAHGITRKQELCSLYTELQDSYGIDLNKRQIKFCREYNTPYTGEYTLNTIGDDDDLRIQFDLLLDTYIGQLTPAHGEAASY